MPRPFKQYVPQGIGEIMDHLGMMMLSSPTFKDDYFTDQNIETVFAALNEGLELIRKELGEERYEALVALSDRMRAHFEADPEDKTKDAIAGRELIHEMEDLLTKRKAKARIPGTHYRID